jgi:hypothetical protein
LINSAQIIVAAIQFKVGAGAVLANIIGAGIAVVADYWSIQAVAV